MRAARFDVEMEAGADYHRIMQVWQKDVPVNVMSIVAGDRIFLDGLPELVYSSTVVYPDKVALRFRQGLWNQPSIVVDQAANVFKAKPMPLVAVVAKYYRSPFRSVVIPAVIDPDGHSVDFGFTADESNLLSRDYGLNPWDMFVQSQADTEWTRIAEGSWSIIPGQARGSLPVVTPYP